MPDHDPIKDAHGELQRTRPELDELLKAAEALCADPDQLHTSLTGLLGDGNRLAEVAARSSTHPNGFAKVVLHASRGHDYGVRLHIWPSEHEQPVCDPHGHRWEFASWVVAGTLRETTFAESTVDSDQYERRDYGRDERGRHVLRDAGSAALRPIAEVDRRAGTVYSRPHSVLHTATPVGQELVASLVLQSPLSSPSTAVYKLASPAGEKRPNQLPDQQLKPDDLRSLLDEVTAAIR